MTSDLWSLLPYRLQQWWHSRRLHVVLAELNTTPPIRAGSAALAHAEVFMLLCRRDASLAILALKSLLRFTGERLAVTAIDDGSIDAMTRATFDRHIPGCRWLRVADGPGVAAVLHGRPRLAAVIDRCGPCPKLVFPAAAARLPKAIVLDTDTVFFRAPVQLLDWIATDDAPALYLHDRYRDDRNEAPATVRSRWAEFVHLVGGSRQWRLEHMYFNSGLLAFSVPALDFDIAEAFLGFNDALDAEAQSGLSGIWFGPWTQEQSSYMAMYGFLNPPPQPFGPDYTIERPVGAVFCHFLRAGLRRPETPAVLGRVIAELNAR